MLHYPLEYYGNAGWNKEDAIKRYGAWQICFVEDLKKVPVTGEVVGGRRQIDSNNSHLKFNDEFDPQSFRDFLRGKEVGLKTPKMYKYEKGFTAEQDLWMRLTYLLSDQILVDYSPNDRYSIVLPESYNVELEMIPTVQFIGDEELERVSLLGDELGMFGDNSVCRTLIMLK